MSDESTRQRHGFHPDEIDLSKLSVEELASLKATIIASAKRKVGPEDFNPLMMATGDVVNPWDYFTDPADFLNLIATLIRAVELSFRRVSLAIVTAAVAISFGGLQTAFGTGSFVIASIFAIWFVAEMARGFKQKSRG